jgi:hypothetical protein
MRTSSGIGVSASSWRSARRPPIAVLNSFPSATLMNEEATYGRSFTYWARAAVGDAGPFLPLTRAMGSNSRTRAAVHRSSDASG